MFRRAVGILRGQRWVKHERYMLMDEGYFMLMAAMEVSLRSSTPENGLLLNATPHEGRHAHCVPISLTGQKNIHVLRPLLPLHASATECLSLAIHGTARLAVLEAWCRAGRPPATAVVSPYLKVRQKVDSCPGFRHVVRQHWGASKGAWSSFRGSMYANKLFILRGS